MKFSQFLLEFFGKKTSNEKPFLWFFIIALIAVLPNALFFSGDEIAIYMGNAVGFFNDGVKSTKAYLSHSPLLELGVSQAADGRYSYAAFCWILAKIGIDYQSFVVLSLVSYAFGLAVIYFSLFRLSGNYLDKTTIIGFIIFLTFGLSLDQMQFSVESFQYMACMLAVSGIAVLSASSINIFYILLFGTSIFAIGVGFYQNILQMTAYFILSYFALQSVSNRPYKPIVIQASLMSGCAILGSIVYVIINLTLKHLGAAWFQDYPVRHQGLSNIIKNIPQYFITIPRAFGIFGHRYMIMLPHIVSLIIIVVFGFYIAYCWHIRKKQKFFPFFLVVAAILIMPNPANLLLEGFYPSPRTLSALGLFIAVLVAIICRRGKAGTWLSLFLISLQIAVVFKWYGHRHNQWVADVAVAENLILEAYRNTPASMQPNITISVSAGDLTVTSALAYYFGGSLFSTPWSSEAFLQYVSGGRVSVSLDSGIVCSKTNYFLSVNPKANGINVCFYKY